MMNKMEDSQTLPSPTEFYTLFTDDINHNTLDDAWFESRVKFFKSKFGTEYMLQAFVHACTQGNTEEFYYIFFRFCVEVYLAEAGRMGDILARHINIFSTLPSHFKVLVCKVVYQYLRARPNETLQISEVFYLIGLADGSIDILSPECEPLATSLSRYPENVFGSLYEFLIKQVYLRPLEHNVFPDAIIKDGVLSPMGRALCACMTQMSFFDQKFQESHQSQHNILQELPLWFDDQQMDKFLMILRIRIDVGYISPSFLGASRIDFTRRASDWVKLIALTSNNPMHQYGEIIFSRMFIQLLIRQDVSGFTPALRSIVDNTIQQCSTLNHYKGLLEAVKVFYEEHPTKRVEYLDLLEILPIADKDVGFDYVLETEWFSQYARVIYSENA